MKKLICWILPLFSAFMFCGCEISNAEIASSLEGNMTRLVYQVGYLDSIPSAELESLVSSNNYFTNYRNSLNSVGLESNNVDASNVIDTGYADYTNSFRSYVYNSTPTNNSAISNTTSPISSSTTDANSLVAEDATANNNNSSTVSYVDISLIETSQEDLNEILLLLSQKRGIIMLYCTDLRGGNLDLLAEDKQAISEYITILKETTNYLSSSTGLLTSHYNNIVEIAQVENNQELINAKLIRASEILKTRYAKLDTCIDSLDAIISILRNYVGYDYNTLQNQTTMNNVAQVDYENNVAEIISNEDILQNTTTDNLANENHSQNTNACLDNNCCDNYINNDCSNNLPNNCENCLPTPTTDITTSSTPADQNNTIINNNFGGTSTQNNNIDSNQTKTSSTPTTFTPQTTQNIPTPNNITNENIITPSPAVLPEILPDTIQNETISTESTEPIAINNQETILDDNTLNDFNDEEIVLNGGFVRNISQTTSDNNITNNQPTTSFQRVNNNPIQNNGDYPSYTPNGIDTAFNNPASAPSPINSGQMISAFSASAEDINNGKRTDKNHSPLDTNNTQKMIDSIERPQKMDFPEPVNPPTDISLLPEVIEDKNNSLPESVLPFSGNNPETSFVPLDNQNFAELGIIKILSPSSYKDIPLKTLPLT